MTKAQLIELLVQRLGTSRWKNAEASLWKKSDEQLEDMLRELSKKSSEKIGKLEVAATVLALVETTLDGVRGDNPEQVEALLKKSLLLSIEARQALGEAQAWMLSKS